jgi:hypothetical protein
VPNSSSRVHIHVVLARPHRVRDLS